jgi:hypothetical protein
MARIASQKINCTFPVVNTRESKFASVLLSKINRCSVYVMLSNGFRQRVQITAKTNNSILSAAR